MVWSTLARHFWTRAAESAPVDAALVARVEAAGRHLGRSLEIRHVAAGSCNACELELRATQNLIYDLTQYGLSFTPSPRHADILLITGVAGRNMLEAVGDCAVDGGVFKGAPMVSGGADAMLPVDLAISGCPPSPAQIVAGLLALVEAASDGSLRLAD
jgi:Ni,Fe-hydrogenase III small subunit